MSTCITQVIGQTDDINLTKINMLISIAQQRDQRAAEAFEEVHVKRQRLEEDLADAAENPSGTAKKVREKWNLDLKLLQKEEKALQNKRQTYHDFIVNVTSYATASPKKRAQFVADYERKNGNIDNLKLAETDVKTGETDNKKMEMSSSPPTVSEPSKTVVESPMIALENGRQVRPQGVENTTKQPAAAEQTADVKSVSEPVMTGSKPKTTSEKPKKKENTRPKNKEIAEKSKPKPNKEKKKKGDNTDEKPVEIASETAVNAPNNTENEPNITPVNQNTDKPNNQKPKKENTKNSNVTTNSYRNYEPKTDVFINPLPPQCSLTFDGIDPFTGKYKRETAPTRLLSYTDEAMANSLKDKDFIVCDASFSRVEGSRHISLNLTFTVQGKDAQRTLGFLDKGTPIIFKLINETKIILYTTKTDIGSIDFDNGTTVYKAQLVVANPEGLMASELDFVRVVWSIGYDDYEVFDVAVLQNLFSCLNKK